MRNTSTRLRTLGTAVAIAATLLTVNATQAMAVQWSPQNTTIGTPFNVHLLKFDFGPAKGLVTCKSTMTGKGIGATFATLPSTGVTISDCTNSLFVLATGGVANGWNVNATSTSAATINIPSGGLKLTKTDCTITIGSGALALSAQWSNGAHNLTISPGASVPYTSAGVGCATGGGSVTVSTNSTGWYFPGLSIV